MNGTKRKKRWEKNLLLIDSNVSSHSGSMSFQVVHHVGPPLHVTAAAKTTKAMARARAAPPSTSSPRPALRASQKPALPRELSSVARSAASHTPTPTSKPWTGRRKRAPLPCSSSPNIGGRVTCCARLRQAPVTPAPARRGRRKRSWRLRKSWKSAFKTSARSRSQKGSPRGSTCGRQTCWENTVSEPAERTEGANTWGQGSVYMFFDHDFCNKREITLNSFEFSFCRKLCQ